MKTNTIVISLIAALILWSGYSFHLLNKQKQRLESVELKLQRANSSIDALESEVSELQYSKDELESGMSDVKSSIDDLESEIY